MQCPFESPTSKLWQNINKHLYLSEVRMHNLCHKSNISDYVLPELKNLQFLNKKQWKMRRQVK